MIILETKRLQIFELEKSPTAFILELINEPAWCKYIDNTASGNLLEKLGLTFDRIIELSEEGKD